MTTTTTIEISNDNETITKVDVELEVERGIYVTRCYFPSDFDKEVHGMWRMERNDQLLEQGFIIEHLEN